MNFQEIKGLKYFLIYAFAVISFFSYSAFTGWKWFNPTETSHERSTTKRIHGTRGYLYHK